MTLAWRSDFSRSSHRRLPTLTRQKRKLLLLAACGWFAAAPAAIAQQKIAQQGSAQQGSAQQGSAQAAPVREIEALIDRQTALLMQRDSIGLAALFTSDAIYIGATGAVSSGTDGIRNYYAQTFAAIEYAQSAALIGDFSRDNKVYQVQALGDGAWALGRGSLLVNGPSGVVARTDHWAAVFAKVGGEWKIRMMSVGEDAQPPSEPLR